MQPVVKISSKWHLRFILTVSYTVYLWRPTLSWFVMKDFDNAIDLVIHVHFGKWIEFTTGHHWMLKRKRRFDELFDTPDAPEVVNMTTEYSFLVFNFSERIQNAVPHLLLQCTKSGDCTQTLVALCGNKAYLQAFCNWPPEENPHRGVTHSILSS